MKSEIYEIELISGLEAFVERELTTVLGRNRFRLLSYPRDGRLTIRFRGAEDNLSGLTTAVAVHALHTFNVPRPKALLGHQHLSRLFAIIRSVVGSKPDGTFTTFKISAAGIDSPVFRRLANEITNECGLVESTQSAHLLLGVRPVVKSSGWDITVRLTSMPLSARPWRVCNRPDALNATIAKAMIMLADPTDTGCFVNLGCGSGTLLAERLLQTPSSGVFGFDIDPGAIACAELNLSAAKVRDRAMLSVGDLCAVPMSDQSADAIVADLPFGMVKGTDVGLSRLYDAALSESVRLLSTGGAFVVMTARRTLFEETLERFQDQMERTAEVPLSVSFKRGYLKPSIYMLRRL